MTCSVVAVITDVPRDGKPVVGSLLKSNGRYGHGALMRERLIPRLFEGDPKAPGGCATRQPRPHKIRVRTMINKKPGGHGGRRPLSARMRELLQASDAKLDELAARWAALKVEYAGKADQKIRHARASLAELRRELRQAIDLLDMAGVPA